MAKNIFFLAICLTLFTADLPSRSSISAKNIPTIEDIKELPGNEAFLVVDKIGESQRVLMILLIKEGDIFIPSLRKASLRTYREVNGVVERVTGVEIEEDNLFYLQFVMERNEIPHLVERKRKSWIFDHSRTNVTITISQEDSFRVIQREAGESIPVDNFISFLEWLSMI